jgi:hypothetical protein
VLEAPLLSITGNISVAGGNGGTVLSAGGAGATTSLDGEDGANAYQDGEGGGGGGGGAGRVRLNGLTGASCTGVATPEAACTTSVLKLAE